MEIDLPVPEKKIFKGFLPYMGMAAILIIRPASCHQIFISLYLKAFIKNLAQIVVFTIYGHGGHLGHVTSITLTNLHFLVPESFHTKFSSEWHSSF